ncbi:MAG: hypothetical protein HN390_13800 [Anaerolineae bacterium]|jgi:hypothetical protein|nr:hypothetical protein [Anaerolineae bacterium]MBT7189730.1 hypothetical protein [Anaerolineae bacterium]MBT7601434.1 hypothetical protein [Anaerolineae bacterium]MBT7991109.1 hypothetical protein [Anaerolineae bacterium]
MSKFFNKWTRIIHRWFALPTLILIPLAVIAKFSGTGEHLPPQVEQIQSILMLLLAISGGYLYLVPYIAKKNRAKRKKAKVTVTQGQ